MGRSLSVVLSDAQRLELDHARAHHPKPYIRERAAAILKVASGLSVRSVASSGLLVPREPETLSAWISRYLAHGLPGLLVQPGRGRKPAFLPSPPLN